ncbi:MAG: hypothetical protein Sapg2KO_47050 [Saprospiraceae bacterium]
MEISVNIHYPDFLEQPEIYKAVSSFWEAVLRDQLESEQQEWHPFYQNKDQDGNPVFSAWLPKQHKLLRIIQFIPEPGDTLFSSWVDQWQGDWPKGIPQAKDLTNLPVPELVLDLAMTTETIQLAQTLIHLWIAQDQSPAQLEKLFSKEMLPKP